jgi:gamma-glutamylaminecyclotransferase
LVAHTGDAIRCGPWGSECGRHTIPEKPARTILFVYGTLKQGGRNHRLIGGQCYLGEAATEPRYRLFDLGPYPGLVRDDAAGLSVAGELWEVSENCIGELDEFECAADEFVRETVAVNGRADRIEAYFYAGPIPAGAASGAGWPFTS